MKPRKLAVLPPPPSHAMLPRDSDSRRENRSMELHPEYVVLIASTLVILAGAFIGYV